MFTVSQYLQLGVNKKSADDVEQQEYLQTCAQINAYLRYRDCEYLMYPLLDYDV